MEKDIEWGNRGEDAFDKLKKITIGTLSRIETVKSPDHRKKNSEGLKGKPRTEDLKKKVSESKIKPYAIYKGKEYSRPDLSIELGVHVNTLTYIKKGELENKYELVFLDNVPIYTKKPGNRGGSKLFAIYEGVSYCQNDLAQLLKISRGTLHHIKKGNSPNKYNLTFL